MPQREKTLRVTGDDVQQVADVGTAASGFRTFLFNIAERLDVSDRNTAELFARTDELDRCGRGDDLSRGASG